MFLKIEKEICDIGNGIYSGAVIAYGINSSEENSTVNDLYNKQMEKIIEEYKLETVKEDENVQLYRNAMKKIGVNPSKYPPSVEALLKRIVRNQDVTSFCSILNLVNYISIKYRIPVGIHDIDSLENGLCLRLATENDCNAEKDVPDIGEPIYASGNSVRTRRWFWRQTLEGRISPESKNFIFLLDGFVDNKVTIDMACEELMHLLSVVYMVRAERRMLSSENPEIFFGSLNEEEKEIENQINIMLKGVAQNTGEFEIRQKLKNSYREGKPLRIKLGLDPSAPDIHLGHSVVLRKIRQLQDLGHKAIIIIGDYTGMIGDPTGKSKTRKQLSKEEVKKNADTYLAQIFKIIDKTNTEVYYNSEWFSKMEFSDIIELASKCTVARMLERDDFNNRFSKHLPLSVHEFFYPLMQAYDSVAVRADIELGGTDQTFNILLGRNIQKAYGQSPQLTLFMPLLEGTDGIEKMSKSLGNYIGIDESPVVMYEKVMKIPDDLIIKYYTLCTDLHPNEIEKIQKKLTNGVNPRDIKMLLAYEITMLYHSRADADYAQEHFKMVFQNEHIPEDAPILNINRESLILPSEQVIEILVREGYFKSKSEVRRLFIQGGVKLDGIQIRNSDDLNLKEGEQVLRIGKSKYFKIILK
ncbi:tyrosine--tRNA ligase [Butyribacter intestini]|jgi:tyrosyl-tRNA synthetase|nr:tyrosine--tRNA ligase [Butyribacter intestini]